MVVVVGAVLSRVLHIDAQIADSRTSLYYLSNAMLREFIALLVATRWGPLAISLAIMGLAIGFGLLP